MSYREQVLNAYLESLKSYGMSELMINAARVAFESGFNAGLLHNDENMQGKMIDLLLYEEKVN